MRGLIRLFDGLLQGDVLAFYVLLFTVVGTVLIYLAAEVVQRRRRGKRDDDEDEPPETGPSPRS